MWPASGVPTMYIERVWHNYLLMESIHVHVNRFLGGGGSKGGN